MSVEIQIRSINKKKLNFHFHLQNYFSIDKQHKMKKLKKNTQNNDNFFFTHHVPFI